jgi:putative tricarboxylic transport membrane protein
LLFGLILGHTLEQSFRQALTISNGDPTVFFRSPIAAGLLCCAALMVGASIWSKRRPVKELEQAEARIAKQRLAEEQR